MVEDMIAEMIKKLVVTVITKIHRIGFIQFERCSITSESFAVVTSPLLL